MTLTHALRLRVQAEADYAVDPSLASKAVLDLAAEQYERELARSKAHAGDLGPVGQHRGLRRLRPVVSP